jgi:hypothetical protein
MDNRPDACGKAPSVTDIAYDDDFACPRRAAEGRDRRYRYRCGNLSAPGMRE